MRARMIVFVCVVVALMAVPGSGLFADSAVAGTSPMTIAKKVLGHPPRGLARTIVLRRTVRVANDLDYPPQSYIDPTTHKLVGFDVDVAKRVARILGLRVAWKHPLWVNIPAGLRRGRFDVSIGSMTVTPERKKLVAFARPYYFSGYQVVVQTGGTQIAGPADLAGKTVGAASGTVYVEYLEENTEAIVAEYASDLDALADLAAGNIDFAMTHPCTGQKAILEGKALEFSGKPLYYESIAFALKKGESDWRALLNYTVQKMHRDGSLTTMSKKWYDGLDLTVKQ